MREEGLLVLDEDGRSVWLYGTVYMFPDQSPSLPFGELQQY